MSVDLAHRNKCLGILKPEDYKAVLKQFGNHQLINLYYQYLPSFQEALKMFA